MTILRRAYNSHPIFHLTIVGSKFLLKQYTFYPNLCKLSLGILLSIIFVLDSDMKHLNNNKKKNIIASATLFTLASIIVIAGAATAITTTIQSAEANLAVDIPVSRKEAPVVVSGENMYVGW
jgi:hypothetical protein